MCEGQHWSYWATGLPGWMRGGGRHRRYGHPSYAYRPESWPGASPYGFGPWRGEPNAEDELAFLKEEAESLKHYLEGIERRMTELEKVSAARDTS
jgi:hypothetical protein